MISAADLFTCINAQGRNAWPYNRKPIPPWVTDGGGNEDISDSFITMYSGSPHVVWPVTFTPRRAGPSAAFTVQSPNGFTAPTPADEAEYSRRRHQPDHGATARSTTIVTAADGGRSLRPGDADARPSTSTIDVHQRRAASW